MVNGIAVPLHTVHKAPVARSLQTASAPASALAAGSSAEDPQGVEEEGFVLVERDPQDTPDRQGLDLSSTGETFVLEIDIEAAWRELRLEPGWSNQVVVEVIVYV